MSIRVVVAEDFPLMRRALIDCFDDTPNIEVVGQAADGAEALRVAHEQRPDVLLLDLRMPGVGGLEALARVREELPDVRVLVVTASEKRESLTQALGGGAAGYVTKRSSMDEICEAVATVHAGGGAISPDVTVHLLDVLAEGPRRPSGVDLSARERAVVRLLSEGLTDDEIAQRLSVSARTVQSHLAAVRNKTGLRRRPELARWATENKLLDP